MNTRRGSSGVPDRAAALWAGKLAAAQTPAAIAVVEFDHLRAALAKLSDQQARRTWTELASHLRTVRAELERSHSP